MDKPKVSLSLFQRPEHDPHYPTNASYVSAQERAIMREYEVVAQHQEEDIPVWKGMTWLKYNTLYISRYVLDSRLINMLSYVKQLTGISLSAYHCSYFRFTDDVGAHVDVRRTTSLCFPVDNFIVTSTRSVKAEDASPIDMPVRFEDRQFVVVNTKMLHSAKAWVNEDGQRNAETYFIGATFVDISTVDLVKRINDRGLVTQLETY